MSKFINDKVNNLKTYEWGLQFKKDNLIKVNTNENPYPPSPLVLDVIQNLNVEDLTRYPDPYANELKETISKYYQLEPDNIFIGNGSDDVIAHCLQAFFNQSSKLLFSEYCYGLYEITANLYEIPFSKSKLNNNFTLNLDDFKNNNASIVLANPNVPSGAVLDKNIIENILITNKDYLVIIDEAYCDFSRVSVVDLIAKYDNLVVIQTLSKSRSLAGLRIGIALGNAKLIEAIHKIRDCINPYNVNSLALKAANQAFIDKNYFNEVVKKIVDTREKFKQELNKLKFEVYDSQTNFVLVRYPKLDSKIIYEKLLAKDILVRYFNINEGYLRISISIENDMEKILKELQLIIEGEY